MINVITEGIFFINKNREIKSCNPAAEQIFNIKSIDVIGKKVKELSDSKLSTILKGDEIYTSKGNFTLQNINITYEPVIFEGNRIGTVVTSREVSKIQQLETKIRRELHTKGLVAKYTFNDIIYQSQALNDAIHLANEYANTDSTVLIIGESGAGKELIVQGIHNASKRKEGPFVAVNCAALPESLLESELFGYVEGAFTGAMKGGKQGLFELAHGGTIFLDEVGEIPQHIQTRLLRILQEKVVMRVGGDRIIPVDIRIIAVTNRNLWKLVKEGKFRLDLYFRLSVVHLNIPPLRKRNEDIPVLVDHFLQMHQSDLTFKQLSNELQKFLLSYYWSGNIRQLENITERLHLRQHNLQMNVEDFINQILLETGEHPKEIQDGLTVNIGTMEEIKKQVIKEMLDRYNQNQTLVAQKLGISRTTLWKKINN
ncbi:sigma-54 interaction domain-containing protein [Oceanobacillus jeddahense]|uniref:Sigma 54-interacting transcriptional regulator n=1 Tax=Oceanobacillus jeddahense TaxID=1462527 RepID=A0ABY5JU82_9BACI|nr:sigma 54-interacting transcriptional regulator [Oceanobacillus jeddahense]UUI02437.1 sigma 54-interacting transcriptional regulator [Oceanobacillus jeddahense]